MEKTEKDLKALEQEKNNSTEKKVLENKEEIISDEDAQVLEGGTENENTEISRPTEGSLGGFICCNG